MKDPAFLFYPNDYIGGTMGMTFEEKGAYIELLMLQFNRGHMTSQMVGQTIGQLWDKIQDKFIKDNDGLYFNARLELEIKKRQTFVNSRYNNLSGKNQYTKEEGHTDGHMTSRMENEDVIVNEDINKINIVFEVFWNLYAKKVGDKERCRKKWNKLTNEDRQRIIDSLPEFISSIREKQYQPFPETYLNQKRWNDEITEEDNRRVIGGYYENV